MTINTIFETPQNGHYLSGYYDAAVFSPNGQYIAAAQIQNMYQAPTFPSEVKIHIFDLKTGQQRFVGATNIFNFQQGIKLNWLSDNKIVYNKLVNLKFKSVVADIKSGSIIDFGSAIYSVSPDKKYGLCLDYERHYWCRRGYAYPGIENTCKNKPIVDEDYISRVDFLTSEEQIIIKIDDILEIHPQKSFKNATHYLEHMMISPCSKFFVFYHRWRDRDGNIFTRLFLCDCENDYQISLIHQVGRLSHVNWFGSSELICVGSPTHSMASRIKNNNLTKYIYKCLRPAYRLMVRGSMESGQNAISKMVTGDKYFKLDVNTKKCTPLLMSELQTDGHPSMAGDDLMITDTYPKSNNSLDLLLIDLSKMKVLQSLSFKSDPLIRNSPLRCDLHPKVDVKNRLVAIDSSDNQFRSVKVLSFD